jgi:hypothetical protein
MTPMDAAALERLEALLDGHILPFVVTRHEESVISNATDAPVGFELRDMAVVLNALPQLLSDLRAYREALRLGYALSTNAAAVNWNGRGNRREWLEGLRDDIEAFQEAYGKLGFEQTGMDMADPLAALKGAGE